VTYLAQYQANKRRCGAKIKPFSTEQVRRINEKLTAGWTPDVIIDRGELTLGCSMKMLYRRFKDSDLFDTAKLPMRGKCKPNGHQERDEASRPFDEALMIAKPLIRISTRNSGIWKTTRALARTVKVR